MQAIIETLLSSEKIRRPSEFFAVSVAKDGSIQLRLIRYMLTE